jgi:hypothetical protein
MLRSVVTAALLTASISALAEDPKPADKPADAATPKKDEPPALPPAVTDPTTTTTTADPTTPTTDAPTTLSSEEIAKLKAQLKSELKAEVQAELKAQELNAQLADILRQVDAQAKEKAKATTQAALSALETVFNRQSGDAGDKGVSSVAVALQARVPQVIERAPRRRDHDMRAAAQADDLTVELLPAVDRHDRGAEATTVAMERLRHLHGELARRHEDKRERLPRRRAFIGHALQDRQRERRGLARARRGLPEDVAPRQQRRTRSPLNRRRFFVPERGELDEEFTPQAERGERVLGGVGGRLRSRRDAVGGLLIEHVIKVA